MPRHEPERTCIVTREAQSPAGLIRFVLGPDNQVVPDLRHKLPGRGVWVTARFDKVEEAAKRRLFSRAFKTEARASETLAADIESLLREDLRQGLSLANKAGSVTPASIRSSRPSRISPSLPLFMPQKRPKMGEENWRTSCENASARQYLTFRSSKNCRLTNWIWH